MGFYRQSPSHQSTPASLRRESAPELLTVYGGPPSSAQDPCASEPIHVPGAIQSGGALLVLDPDAERIVQAAGLAAVFASLPPIPSTLQRALPELGGSEGDALRETVAAGGVHRSRLFHGGRHLDLTAHRNEQGLVIVELEPGVAPEAELVLRRRLAGALDRLERASELATTLDAAARGLRDVLGYDRVVVYRFHPGWDGEVVAEARDDALEPLLGLRFPASDIPAQARRLLHRVPMRLLTDAEAPVAPLEPPQLPGLEEPTDLRRAVLRAQSPMHLAYLAALGVRASGSFSLVRGDRLWGLAILHHRTPRRLPGAARFAGEVLARWVSREIEVAEERGRVARQRTVEEHLQHLRRRAERAAADGAASGYWDDLLDGTPSLAALVVCDGVAVVADGDVRVRGQALPGEAIEALVRWLDPRTHDSGIWTTDELLRDVPWLGRDPHLRAGSRTRGALAVRLSPVQRDFVLWFRDEAIQTLTWAGDPTTTHDVSPNAPPGPRRSFAAWRETIRERSWPWASWERRAAAALVAAVNDVDRRTGAELRLRADLLSRVEEEVARRADDGSGEAVGDAAATVSIARMAAHDLKEPLRGIRGYARFLLEDHGPRLDGEGRQMLGALERLSHRLEQLVDDLGTLARSVRGDLQRASVDAGAAVAAVLELLGPRLDALGAAVEIAGPLPTVRCDRTALEQVLANLIVNAAKYSDGSGQPITVGVEPGTSPPVLYVRDQGIGIAAEDAGRIFEPFQRLHPRGGRWGDGSGLGLAIVARLVERHGGRVWVDSSPGAGATFRFVIGEAVAG